MNNTKRCGYINFNASIIGNLLHLLYNFQSWLVMRFLKSWNEFVSSSRASANIIYVLDCYQQFPQFLILQRFSISSSTSSFSRERIFSSILEGTKRTLIRGGERRKKLHDSNVLKIFKIVIVFPYPLVLSSPLHCCLRYRHCIGCGKNFKD